MWPRARNVEHTFQLDAVVLFVLVALSQGSLTYYLIRISLSVVCSLSGVCSSFHIRHAHGFKFVRARPLREIRNGPHGTLCLSFSCLVYLSL